MVESGRIKPYFYFHFFNYVEIECLFNSKSCLSPCILTGPFLYIFFRSSSSSCFFFDSFLGSSAKKKTARINLPSLKK